MSDFNVKDLIDQTSLKPFPNLNVVKVTIKPGRLLEQYSRELYNALCIHNGNQDLPFTEEDLYLYMCHCVEQRVKHVNHERGAVPRSDFQMKMPCFLYFILSQIGKCEIPRVQALIVPNFERDPRMSLESKDEIHNWITRIGELISIIAPKAVAKSWPQHEEGNEDFMTFTVVENLVCNASTESEPVMAMAASFIEATRANDVITSHVVYGNIDRYQRHIITLATVGTNAKG